MMMAELDFPRSIEEQAAALLARVDADPTSRARRSEAEAWRALDPRHEVVYLRLQAAWRHLNRIQAIGSYESAAFHFKDASPVTKRRGRTLAWAASFVGALFALAATWWFAGPRGDSGSFIVATPLGGYQSRVLEDGSTLEVNTSTRLEVNFQRKVRNIRLLQGEARFRVAKDSHRPFVVEVGGTKVVAVGTDFAVRLRSAATEVLVSEGRVRLDAPRSGSMPQIPTNTLNSGQLAVVAERAVRIRTLAPQEIDARLAWDSGMLVFAGDSLQEVTEQFNRYNVKQLRLADQNAAGLRIDGSFRATNLEAFVRLLQQGFPVTVTQSHSTILISSKTPDTQN